MIKAFDENTERAIAKVYQGTNQVSRIYQGTTRLYSSGFHPRYDIADCVLDLDTSNWTFKANASDEVASNNWNSSYEFTSFPIETAPVFTAGSVVNASIFLNSGAFPFYSGLRQQGLSNYENAHTIKHQPATFDAGNIKRVYFQTPGYAATRLQIACGFSNTNNISIYVVGIGWTATGSTAYCGITQVGGGSMIINPNFNTTALGYSDITNYTVVTSYKGSCSAGTPEHFIIVASMGLELGQVLIYNRELTTQEDTDVTNFLKTKWGIP